MEFLEKKELVLSNKSKCEECSRHMDDLVVFTQKINHLGNWVRSSVHLSCFKPLNLMQLFSYSKDERIQKFIEDWNSQFCIEDVNKLFPYIAPRLPLVHSKFRRLWTEVFKFFTYEEIASLQGVCKEFYSIGWTEELWNITPVHAAKLSYLRLKFNTCVVCEESDTEKLIRCPMLKKAFCRRCRVNPFFSQRNKKYVLYRINSLIRFFNTDWGIVERQSIPFFYMGAKNKIAVTYKCFFEEALVKDEANFIKKHPMQTRKRRRS